MTDVPSSVADLGPVLAAGRSAEVFRLPDRRVLKLALPGVPADDVTAERENCAEAVELGVTPLACRGEVEVEGRSGLVLDAADGESLQRWGERNIVARLRETGRILAREHVALHRARTTRHGEVRAVAAHLLDAPVFAALGTDSRARTAERLAALPAGDALLHMDFHTLNVFAHADGWAVIDWQTSLRGAPAADVAMSLLLLRDSELWPGTPRWKQVVFDAVRRRLAAAYLAEYLALSGLTAAEVADFRVVALVLRLGTWDIASERDRFLAELRQIVG